MTRSRRLASFRHGWENENLARYLLSRFCFVAHPASVSDDLGSDFYCTTFERQKNGGKEYLVPKNSFAVQIKSNRQKIDVSDKVPYLRDLEIPFFVGVCDSKCSRLDIYSGEYIPILFSQRGDPACLQIDLCERDGGSYFGRTGDATSDTWVIRFPRVATLTPDADHDQLRQVTETMIELCSVIHLNISSRKTSEYSFIEVPERSLRTFAGPASVKVFRENFLKRLAEVFYNLLWLHRNMSACFYEAEFRVYQSLAAELAAMYGPHALPPVLTKVLGMLDAELDPDRTTPPCAALEDS
jgi:hypothetical protein